MNSSSILLCSAALALVSFSVGCGGGVDPTGQTESTLGSTSSGDDGTTSTAKGPSTAPICKGGLPDVCEVCADGKSECAHWVVVHGKCEVEICGDPSATPPPASTAPICRGPLPDTCEVCADGSSGCAHWEVVHGKCEIEYCAGPSTGPTPSPEPTPVSTSPVPAG